METFSNNTFVNATLTVPPKYCQKCGAVLGTTTSIVGGLEFHPWCTPLVQQYGEDHDTVVEALKTKISWLEYFVRIRTEERDTAQREVTEWRTKWEKERNLNCERHDRLEDAIAKIYEWVEEVQREEL